MQRIEEDKDPIPHYYDFNNKELSKISIWYYEKRYGSYNNFLKTIGDPLNLNRKVTTQHLIDNYFKVEKKVGRVPFLKDMNNKNISSFHSNTYKRHFGKWSIFLKSIDRLPSVFRNVPDKELIDNYFKVKKMLGRTPNFHDMYINISKSKYGGGSYQRKYGSWNNFLKSIGEITYSNTRKNISNDDLINNYYEVKKILGRIPTCRDMYNKKISKFHSKLYVRNFSSWTKFLISIGEI